MATTSRAKSAPKPKFRGKGKGKAGPRGKGKGAPRGENWICGKCKNINFPGREVCNRGDCGAPRSGGTSTTAKPQTKRSSSAKPERPLQEYTREGEMSFPVDVAAVNDLLKQRAQCRRKQKYNQSDRLRDQLRDEHGVYVNDESHTWLTISKEKADTAKAKAADGDGGDESDDSSLPSDSDDDVDDDETGTHNTRNAGGATPANTGKGRADAAGAAKKTKAAARAKPEQTRRNPEWKASASAAAKKTRATTAAARLLEYRRDGDLAIAVDEESVRDLIRQRSQCRRNKEYKKSDELRDALWEKHGVYVDDKTLTWRKDRPTVGSNGLKYKHYGCYLCGSEKHWASKCPNAGAGGSAPKFTIRKAGSGSKIRFDDGRGGGGGDDDNSAGKTKKVGQKRKAEEEAPAQPQAPQAEGPKKKKKKKRRSAAWRARQRRK